MIFEETGDHEAALRDIPLKQTMGIWHASAAFLPSLVRATRAPFKRTVEPLEEMWAPAYQTGSGRNSDKVLVKRIDQVRDKYVGLTDTYAGQAVNSVLWFGCGDIDRVRSLMSLVTHVGKKSRQGYGKVADIEIESCDEDRSIRLHVGGKDMPMRPVPVDVWDALGATRHDALLRVDAAARPPYFLAPRQSCFVPHTRIQFWRAAAI
jgi:CRISPR type IV-associated protein Csf3